MMMSRRAFLSTCIGLGAFAVVGRQAVRADVVSAQWYLFGTLVDVTVGGLERGAEGEVLTVLSSELQRCNDEWHPWRPGVMGDINRALSSGEAVSVDAQVADIITQTQLLYAASGGLFNPAIGEIVAQWGFHGGDKSNWHVPPLPLIERLAAAAPTPLDLYLDGGRLYTNNCAAQLDLGGYAKGYAIDLGRKLLAERGIEHALINAGGDLVTLGTAPDGSAWRVAIRHPQRTGRIAWLESQAGEAIFTSGNYERYREWDGRRYPHIIDPRSGIPVRGVASVTVVHTDAAFADAAATALVVAGTQGWRAMADKLGVEQAMLVDEQGRVTMTSAMRERIYFDA